MTNTVIAESKTMSEAKRIWASLITNTEYLSGLLTLNHTLKAHGSVFPLVALYTDTFPEEGKVALDARGIPHQRVEAISPDADPKLSMEPRFQDTWSKLGIFGLTQYDRVVQLDSDMIVLQNPDELMDLELDPPMGGEGERVFAAAHACVCNPMKKPRYPTDWIPENCGFTHDHADPELAQTAGAPNTFGLGKLNSGLLVVNPSKAVFDKIQDRLVSGEDVLNKYQFPDQDLLADIFRGRWVPLPYIYNALKTLRHKGVHDKIWRDDRVKIIHYILMPKPWSEKPGEETDETNKWWTKANLERLEVEKRAGIDDGY